eukprot:SAG31_NODE_3087_length_4690_cov_30.948377_8_plen_111_part_00
MAITVPRARSESPAVVESNRRYARQGIPKSDSLTSQRLYFEHLMSSTGLSTREVLVSLAISMLAFAVAVWRVQETSGAMHGPSWMDYIQWDASPVTVSCLCFSQLFMFCL